MTGCAHVSQRLPTRAAPTSPRLAVRFWLAGTLSIVVSAGLIEPCLAHDGQPIAPHDLPFAWNWDAAVIGPLVLAAALYLAGVSRLWRRAGRGRGLRSSRVIAYLAGMMTLVLALVSPLAALDSALFSAHMVQHLLLMLVAAPLLVLGKPDAGLLWALDQSRRRRLTAWWIARPRLRATWRTLTQPLLVWALHALALWAWHLPRAYEAAIRDPAIHVLEHASLLGTALAFWWLLLQSGSRRPIQPGVDVLYLFAFIFQSGILGALMTFASRPWYPRYESTTSAWRLTPLEDQQLAGLIMWIPGGLIYASAALALLASCLSASEQQAQRRERARSLG